MSIPKPLAGSTDQGTASKTRFISNKIRSETQTDCYIKIRVDPDIGGVLRWYSGHEQLGGIDIYPWPLAPVKHTIDEQKQEATARFLDI